ncbi:MAG: carboxypeptidase-like regulatory domain-containing protein [Flavobacteriales bacterium]|nr:carboxypeptidase-like regulatory domain-containing protein [Flavobacteriales bacterium]
MLRRLSVFCALFALAVQGIYAQTGTLKGKVVDKANGEAIPFANVVIERNGVQSGGATTDFDGMFTIKPIDPGKYTVKASYVGYQQVQVDGVLINSDKITDLTIELSSGVDLDVVEFVKYKDPVFKKDETVVQKTVTREDFDKMPTRSAVTAAATSAGAYQSSEGSAINVRGQRSDGTVYYVDGVKVRGSNVSLPQRGIEQVSTMLGGVPAQYGDAVGGIINITTRGPSSIVTGGVEGVTSEFLDGYGYNLVGGSITGPIWTVKDSVDPSKNRTVAGFFISAEAAYIKDGTPSAVGNWKVKDDVLKNLEEEPLRKHTSGSGTLKNAEFLTMDDLENVKAKMNVASKEYRAQGKFDVKPSGNTTISLGGSFDYDNRHNYFFPYSLLNYGKNAQQITTEGRAYARFTQKFDSDTGSAIQNAFYFIQVDYSNSHQTTWDEVHKKDVFDYGYVGKFETHKTNTYNTYGTDPVSGYTGWMHDGFRDTLVEFTRSELNPLIANYTSQYYSFFDEPAGRYENLSQILQGNAMLNGMRPDNVYSLWYMTGRLNNGYSFSDNSQFRLTASGSADIGDHAIQLGFEYEQRTERFYTLVANSLWTLARQLTNFHIANLDASNPQPVFDAWDVFQDTINYPRLYDANAQAYVDKNIRTKLGLPLNSTQWIDIDALDPEFFSLDMFSADELLNDGNGYINYYGYDYLGNKQTSRPSFESFFTDKDDNGNFKREIAPFEPIYVAGYIQDKFAFKDLVFNIGLRVDRYDANQMVLADKYLMQQAKTAIEVTQFGKHPSTIGDDFVVYVNDASNPSAILGYRDGDTWYNAEGTEIADPTPIAENSSTGGIIPYLLDPNNTAVTADVFKDYEPQTNIMPRVAFSFPISDDAVFFAHYDVLTQRPTFAQRTNPISYLYIQNFTSPNLANPDLQPERTTDYEVGFKQKLSPASAISLSAFYRELRDQIQVIPVNFAYPKTYTTYGNVDFGTIKGFSVSYDLRRTGNVRLNANYTLQFADGTGSSATTGITLINDGFPNLRTLSPLSYDVRHRIVGNIDYRLPGGDDYDGPRWFGKPIFQNTGANIILNARSGEPYSAQANITQAAAFGINDRSRLAGSINGSRLPWQFRLDLRVDRSFTLKFKGGESKKKGAEMNVYAQINNLLDADNIVSVYRATGNPDDDGYLTSPTTQGIIEQQTSPQSFRDLYTIKLNNPGNYSLPRRIRLGVMIDF